MNKREIIAYFDARAPEWDARMVRSDSKIAFILVAVRLVVDWRAGLVESRATMVRALIFIIAPIALMYRTQSDLGTTALSLIHI